MSKERYEYLLRDVGDQKDGRSKERCAGGFSAVVELYEETA